MWLRKHITLVVVGCAIVLSLGVVSWRVYSGIRENNRHINEVVLRDRLESYREGLLKYAEARNELPQSLAEFRSSGLAPTQADPITGKDDWQIEIGENPTLLKGKKGIINIHSSSTAISSRGTPYNTW